MRRPRGARLPRVPGAHRGVTPFAVGAALLLTILVGCGRGGGELPPTNVLLITLDTCRRDFLGCYGGMETPYLDALAREGAVFKQAVAQSPLTLPSHASILTGLRPTSHGIRDNGRFRLEERFETMAEILSRHGYATGAAVGAFPVDARFGLDQGFTYYDDDLSQGMGGGLIFRERRAEAVNQAALSWLEGMEGRPFFLWVHYFDPHRPYDPPSPWKQHFADNLYAGEVAYMDAQLGKLVAHLDSLGLRENTLLVILGDHGEGLGDHGEPSHGLFLYDATVMIPLIIVPSDHLAGKVGRSREIDEIVETVDVLPTVLELLEIPTPTGIHGTSMVDLLAGSRRQKNGEEERYAYAETFFPFFGYGWSELRCLRNREWKYIQAPRPELYHLTQDPQELRNLAHARQEIAERMAERLEIMAREERESQPMPLDGDTMAKLRSLGYLGQAGTPPGGRPGGDSTTGPGPPRAGPGAPDPKDMVEVFSAILASGEYMSHREFKRAAALLRRAVNLDPRNEPARLFLGEALRRMGKMDEALKEFQAVVEWNPSSAEGRLGVAVILFDRRALDAAEREVKAALEVRPEWGEARYNLGLIEEARGRITEARRQLELAVEGSPYFIEGWVKLGVLFYQEGNRAAAARAWDQALVLEPRHPGALRGVEGLRRDFGEDSLRVWLKGAGN